jgi:hypothetical protein
MGLNFTFLNLTFNGSFFNHSYNTSNSSENTSGNAANATQNAGTNFTTGDLIDNLEGFLNGEPVNTSAPLPPVEQNNNGGLQGFNISIIGFPN